MGEMGQRRSRARCDVSTAEHPLCLAKTQLRARIAKLRELLVRLRDDLQLEPDMPTTAQLIVGQATILWEMLAELNSSSLNGNGQFPRNWQRILVHWRRF